MLRKLAVLERNKRTLIEDNDMLNKKHKEALKVCMMTAVKGSFTKLYGQNSCIFVGERKGQSPVKVTEK